MTKKYNVLLSIKAKNDLKCIVSYIKNDLKEPIIANKYAKLIGEEIQSLEYYPERNAVIDNDKLIDLKMRKTIINNYIAFYRIDEDRNVVNIERILYGASNWIDKL